MLWLRVQILSNSMIWPRVHVSLVVGVSYVTKGLLYHQKTLNSKSHSKNVVENIYWGQLKYAVDAEILYLLSVFIHCSLKTESAKVFVDCGRPSYLLTSFVDYNISNNILFPWAKDSHVLMIKEVHNYIVVPTKVD